MYNFQFTLLYEINSNNDFKDNLNFNLKSILNVFETYYTRAYLI